MASYFNLTLDSLGVPNPSLSIESGGTYTSNSLVTLTIGTTESPTTGFQMKIWGDVLVGDAANTGIAATEGASTWISYVTSRQIKLSAGDGSKTIYLKIRDDVYNESSQTSDSIILDTSLPVVSITGPDVVKISKISGKNVCSFSFQVDSTFNEYKIKIVGSSGATQDTGTQIGTVNGSTNMSGTGSFAATTPISCQINGTDLELASSGDGVKIIKIFAKDTTNQWST